MFENTERLERTIYRGGAFTIKNVVTLGNKSTNGNKLNPIYTRSYNSTKYNNLNSLEVTSFSQNEYIVFAYNNFEEKVNSEVFISYPHMNNLISFITDMYTMVTKPDMYSESGVNPKYQEFLLESDEFSSGSKLIAMPIVWDNGNSNAPLLKGALLYINSEDAGVLLDIKSIESIGYILSNFNLSLESSNLFIMGMLSELGKNNFTSSNNTNSFNTSHNTFGGNKTKRGLFSNSNGTRPSLGGNANKVNVNKTPHPTVQNEEDSIVEEQQSVVKPPESNAAKLSMTDILSQAEEISVDDLGDIEI